MDQKSHVTTRMWVWVTLVILCLVAAVVYPRQKKNLVIVAAHWNEDLAWLRNSPYPVVIMDKVGSTPHSIRSDARYIATKTKNHGNECTSYIRFIIDNWDTLPEYTAFIHGHETSYHQKMTVFDAIKKLGSRSYYNFNSICYKDWERGMPGFDLLMHWWDDHFKDVLGKKPEKIIAPCCAQFIVSRENIRRVPLEKWRQFWEISMNPRYDSYFSGAAFECIWGMLLGKRPAIDISSCSQCRRYGNKDEASYYEESPKNVSL